MIAFSKAMNAPGADWFVPWGKIFIDGKYMTTTPLQKAIYLTKENHYIEIRNEYYHIWRDSIIWNGNQKIQLSVELKEKL